MMRKPQKISLNIGRSVDIILNRLTPFEKEVLRATCEIKPGQVRTYKWVAQRIGRPKAQRAVVQALKKNPLPFLRPCHRVVGSREKSGGYALGTKLKKKLLDFEQELIVGRKSSGSKKIRE